MDPGILPDANGIVMHGSFRLFLTSLSSVQSTAFIACQLLLLRSYEREREASQTQVKFLGLHPFMLGCTPSLCDLGKVVLLTQPPSPNLVVVELMWSSPVWVVEGRIEDSK